MVDNPKIYDKLKDIIRFFILSAQLDIADINYQFGSDRLNALSLLPRETLPKPGLIIRIISFAKYLIKEIFNAIISETGFTTKNSGLIQFFVFTKNQKDSLTPIKILTDNSYFAGHYVPVDLKYPLWLSYIMALPFFPLVLWRMLNAEGDRRESFYFFFDQHWLLYGYYITANVWLNKTKPRALVLANDHNFPARVIMQIARKRRIPIFYFQHASVTDKFPPLSFDYALLDGIDALEQYERAGPSDTKVFLVGLSKFDYYYKHINRNEQIQTIGICTNNLDNIEYVKLLCQELRRTFPNLKFFLRSHQGDITRYSIWVDIASKYEMFFSDSRRELSFEFLKKIDAIIVGDSNILLEGVLINVFPIYYDFNKLRLDWYGFIKNGLTEYMSEPEQVVQKIQELLQYKPYVRDRAKRYCHTIGTQYDGRSAELAASLISALLNNDLSFMKKWRRIPGVRIEAYEPLPEE